MVALSIAFQILSVLVGFALAELAVAGLLVFLVEPRTVPKTFGRFRFWYTLTLCFSGFSLLSLIVCVVLPLALLELLQLLFATNPFATFLQEYGGLLASLIIFICWWRCLSLAISARAIGRSHTGVATCLIPIVSFIAFAIPLAVAIVCQIYF
jgi:hypothetical protein